MLLATPMFSSVKEEPALDELLANVMRCTGWIMTGGSAQFRHGALAELQSNLHLVLRHARTERMLGAVNVLDEKATRVATSKAPNADWVLDLRRVVGDFEQATKAHLAAAKRR